MIRATATEFKMKLGKYMRAVRAGKQVLVTDRAQPVARLVPYAAGESEAPSLQISQHRAVDAPPLGKVRVKAIAYAGHDTTSMLEADRRR